MPVNNSGGIQGDMLSGIEEESDIYEAFAPHVDTANISLSNESSPGKNLCIFNLKRENTNYKKQQMFTHYN